MSTIVTAISGFDATGSQRLAVASTAGTDDERVLLQDTPTSVQTLGILVNAPEDNAIAHVCVQGVCEAIAGGVIRPFEKVAVHTNGRVLGWGAASSTHAIIGYYLPAISGTTATGYDTVDGDIINVYLFDAKTTLIP